MVTLQALADDLQHMLPRDFDALELWGESFGRPGEDGHTLLSVTVTNDCLRLHFNDDETLAIWNPSGIRRANGELIVLDATAIRWTSYKAARCRTLENLICRDYVRQDDGHIAFRTNDDQIPGRGVFDNTWTAAHPAVKLEVVWRCG